MPSVKNNLLAETLVHFELDWKAEKPLQRILLSWEINDILILCLGKMFQKQLLEKKAEKNNGICSTRGPTIILKACNMEYSVERAGSAKFKVPLSPLSSPTLSIRVDNSFSLEQRAQTEGN